MGTNLITKPIEVILHEADEAGEHTLKRALGPVHLVMLGIGAIIGAGIFVLTGQAAAQYAGPAIMLSYVLAGVACVFAGLCYAEFASMIPVAGSAYTYGYATLGELFAWIIGWDLILEYAFGAATVASGWSSTLVAFLQDYGINLPPQICDTPGKVWVLYEGKWAALATLQPVLDAAGIDWHTLEHATSSFNLLAVLAVAIVTSILVVGIKESANFNTAIVFVKVFAVLTFIVAATAFVLRRPDVAANNWSVVPPAEHRVVRASSAGRALRGGRVVFFAYIGFDAVSTAAQEARNPQRDMPLGILGSLGVCTLLYIVVSGLLTAVVHYSRLNTGAPVSLAIAETGGRWAQLHRQCRGSGRIEHGDAGDAARSVARILLDVPRRAAAAVGRRDPPALPDAVEVDDHRWRIRFGVRGSRADRHPRAARQHRHPARVRHRVCGRVDPAKAAPDPGSAVSDTVGSVDPRARHRGVAVDDARVAARHLAPPAGLARDRSRNLLPLRQEAQPRPASGGAGRVAEGKRVGRQGSTRGRMRA